MMKKSAYLTDNFFSQQMFIPPFMSVHLIQWLILIEYYEEKMSD